jgi:hypothetical protein
MGDTKISYPRVILAEKSIEFSVPTENFFGTAEPAQKRLSNRRA